MVKKMDAQTVIKQFDRVTNRLVQRIGYNATSLCGRMESIADEDDLPSGEERPQPNSARYDRGDDCIWQKATILEEIYDS